MPNKANLQVILRHAEGLPERIKKSQENYLKNLIMKTQPALIKSLTLVLCAIFSLTSCTSEDVNQELAGYEKEFRQDPPPASFLGEWASVSDNSVPIVMLTENTLTMNLVKYGKGIQTINFENLPTLNISDRSYNIYYNGSHISLSKGSTGEYANSITLTIDNDCITRMIVYVPVIEQPQPPVTPIEIN